MANEFKHKDPGTEITQAEYISASGDGHIFACQATGDILYASSTTVLKNLGKGAANTVLNMGGSCIPAWTASPSVTDLTIGGGCITLSAATDIDLLDNTASALSFDATGKTGIIDIVTTNCSEGVTMSGTLGVTGVLTASAGIELGHASDTTIARSGSGAITVEGNQVYLAGGTDVPVSDGGTGASTLTANGILVGNGTSAIAVTATMATKGHLMVGDGSGVPSMLAVGGTCDHVLTVDSGEATGLKWAAAGGVTLSGTTNNTIATVTGANALIGEANLTFDGAALIKKGAGDATFEYTSATCASGDYGVISMRHTTSGADMADGFGAQLVIKIQDSGAATTLAHVGARRAGADNTGDFFVDTACGGTLTQRLLIKGDGDIDFQNNDLLNVGAASNDWTTDALTLKGGTSAQLLTVESTGTAVTAGILLKTAASGSDGGTQITFQEGAGNGQANNKLYLMGYRPGCGYFRMRSNSAGGAGSALCVIRICDDQSAIDANTTWVDCGFDAHDDAMLLWRAFSPEGRGNLDAYALGKAGLRTSKSELADIGVLKRHYKKCGAICEDFLGYNDQRMAALLAGGIYQTRFTVDKNHECHEARLKALEAKIG